MPKGSPAERPVLGLVGLGAIGQIYAEHLLHKNQQLLIHDLETSRVDALLPLGATSASSLAELAQKCDTIILALPSPHAVEATLAADGRVLSHARPGTLIIDMSTIDPWTAVQMHEAAQKRGVDYLDAPISGGAPGGAGTDGARSASVTFLVGGNREAFDRARPTMQMLGERFIYLGQAGSGSALKLISNLVAGLHNLVASEAFVLAAAAGFDPETVLEVFDGTDAKSYWLTDYFAPRIRNINFDPGFSVDLQYKDHRLAAEMGQRLGVPLLFNSLALQTYQLLRAQGLGKRDLVEAVRFLGRLSNANIYEPRPPIFAQGSSA